MTNTSEAIKQSLIRELGKHERDFVGCTPVQIESIKLAQGVLYLPQTYVDFLFTMGKRAGGLFIGTDCFCDQLSSLKTFAAELLIEDETDYQLPDDAFVFLMHQGYQFMYFHTQDKADDPIVYHYMEGDMQPTAKDFTLSQFLRESAAHLISNF
jgi:hypothetical protein